MKTAIIGYPYIGKNREWKKIIESFLQKKMTEKEFYLHMRELQYNHIAKQQITGLDILTIGDFTHYDRMLDLAWMFNLVPKRFRHLTGLTAYYAMACGELEPCQTSKWFTTNYHYVVPEFEGQVLKLARNPLKEQVQHVRARFGKTPRVTLIGPYTFIQLTNGVTAETKGLYQQQIVNVYKQLLLSLQEVGVEWVQLEEPALTKDLRKVDVGEVREIYIQLMTELLPKVMLTTYFEGVQKLSELYTLPVDGFGLDFVIGYEENIEQLAHFPKDKVLALGMIDGQNIWRSNYASVLEKITDIEQRCQPRELWLQTSCHLQHVPVTKGGEPLFQELYDAVSFADEKIEEIVLVKELMKQSVVSLIKQNENEQQLNALQIHPSRSNRQVAEVLVKIGTKDFKRVSTYTRRKRLQQLFLDLPNYPTTIVNGFPQSEKIRSLRAERVCGELTELQYEQAKQQEIERQIGLQQKIGLDVLLYEQIERATMVELFADKLSGMALTRNGWVASHGLRCNKPPIIYGDVAWETPIVVQDIKLAQQKTSKPLKCKITGPTTLLNWSFVREDLVQSQLVMQLALALRKEIKTLEGAGVYIIQVDEPALIETLPLRKVRQSAYIQQSIEAFKFATAVVRDTTQIHALLYYRDCRAFNKVISAIDADVISVEADQTESLFLSNLQKRSYKFGVGFGVGEAMQGVVERERMFDWLQRRTEIVAKDQCWITPDIGYKNKNEEETVTVFSKVIETVNRMKKFY